ncbi:MAG: hypothetical protein JW786_02785 [Desulfobacterales bacterium]|nr:hypothetical protein [Desulfobacterales bacterium]
MTLHIQLKDVPKFITHQTKIISMDIFDTILIRQCPLNYIEEYAAELMADHLAGQGFYGITKKNLLKSRKSFKTLKETCRNPENRCWTVSQWLDQLSDQFTLDRQLVHDVGFQAELNAESAFLCLAPSAKMVIKEIKNIGFPIIGLSDMWLDQRWLDSLLKLFEIELDMIYTSGSMGAAKKDGRIYPKIAALYALTPKSFLHVGDNLFSDKIQAMHNGWRAVWVPIIHPKAGCWIPKPLQKGFLRLTLTDRFMSLLKVESPKPNDSIYSAAYNYLAPLLIVFSIYQWRLFQKYHIQSACYIARDAYCMKIAYDQLSDFLPDSPARYYVRLSRKAIALAHPDIHVISASPLAGKAGKKNMAQWLSNFSLPQPLKNAILKDARLSLESPFNPKNRQKFRQTIQQYVGEIGHHRRQLIKMINDYMNQQVGEWNKQKRMAIIDSGWAGTTQDILSSILSNIDFFLGVYLGVSDQGHAPNSKSLKFGLLRDDYRPPKGRNPWEATAGVIRLWDTLLREPSGTISQLARDDEGRIHPKMESTAHWQKNERKTAEAVVKGLLDGITRCRPSMPLIMNIAKCLSCLELEAVASKMATALTTRPNAQFVCEMQKIGFDEGTADGQWQRLITADLRSMTTWIPGQICRWGLSELIPAITPFVRLSLSIKTSRFWKSAR